MPASKEYFQEYYLTRKRKLMAIVGGDDYHCAMCDYRADDLEFDHIEPADKSFTIGQRIMQSWRPERYQELLAELEKCQLLCPAHHLEKTKVQLSVERGWKHGTMYGWMKKKCTCMPCADAKMSYVDARNKERRSGDARGPYGLPADHGTVKRYRRGCKCDPCKAANALKARERRQAVLV